LLTGQSELEPLDEEEASLEDEPLSLDQVPVEDDDEDLALNRLIEGLPTPAGLADEKERKPLPEGAPARRRDEFVCASCHLVLHRALSARGGLCRDCARRAKHGSRERAASAR